MKFIKEAFVEGRETDTDWDDSKALQNEIRLNTFANNVENFNGRKFGEVIALEQVCPTTGNVLQTFSSRLDAARWIVSNVLKRDDPKGLKAMSLTGNMQMCMAMGYKSYGFYWRTINPVKHQSRLVAAASKVGGTALTVFDVRTKLTKTATYASISDASKTTGISERQIRRIIGANKPSYNGFSFRVYNTQSTKKEFKTLEAAAKFFGVREYNIKNAIAKDLKLNNVTVSVTEPLKTSVKVFQGRKIIGTYKNLTDAAIGLGVGRHAVQKAVNTQRLISGLYRVQRSIE
jgi:hypothetical protein